MSEHNPEPKDKVFYSILQNLAPAVSLPILITVPVFATLYIAKINLLYNAII